jgi:hypothetical protein
LLLVLLANQSQPAAISTAWKAMPEAQTIKVVLASLTIALLGIIIAAQFYWGLFLAPIVQLHCQSIWLLALQPVFQFLCQFIWPLALQPIFQLHGQFVWPLALQALFFVCFHVNQNQ